jgi:hypothetical protein
VLRIGIIFVFCTAMVFRGRPGLGSTAFNYLGVCFDCRFVLPLINLAITIEVLKIADHSGTCLMASGNPAI